MLFCGGVPSRVFSGLWVKQWHERGTWTTQLVHPVLLTVYSSVILPLTEIDTMKSFEAPFRHFFLLDFEAPFQVGFLLRVRNSRVFFSCDYTSLPTRAIFFVRSAIPTAPTPIHFAQSPPTRYHRLGPILSSPAKAFTPNIISMHVFACLAVSGCCAHHQIKVPLAVLNSIDAHTFPKKENRLTA